MRGLKHIVGSLLAAVSVFIVLVAGAYLFETDPEVPPAFVGLMFVVLGVLPLVGAFALLRPALFQPGKACPHCGEKDHHPAGVLRRSNNPWMFYFGGWLIALLWGASRKRQVRCVQCDTLYDTDTRGSRVAGVMLLVFFLLLLFGAIVELLWGSHE